MNLRWSWHPETRDLSEALPQYSGGLGILAGDHLKAACDLGVPLIGVGLLYRAGYFAQGLSADGWQLEHYPSLDPHGLPLKLLRQPDGTAVVINVPLPEGRTLFAHVWRGHGAGGVPRQRGARGLPRDRADPRAHGVARAVLLRGAAGGARRHGVHDAHAG